MFGKYKLIIFLLVLTTSSYSSFLRKGYTDSVTDLKFERLLTCLTSGGVDRNKIHVRGSGEKYNDLNFQWNTLNGYLEPMVYLAATTVSDIQQAVICCRLWKVRIVARSGGHSFAKNGFGDFQSLVVDLASMNKISLNPKKMQCEIGSGARNSQMSYELGKEGFVISQGLCPPVGVSGLILGGGFGHFTRQFGLALDNLIEVEMVDAEGKIRVINNSTDEDLFWALRGGGGGNFGIVSKFTVKIHPAPNTIVYGQYKISLKDFVPFYKACQSIVTSSRSKNIFCEIRIENYSIGLTLAAFYSQNRENVSEKRLDRLYKSFGFPAATNSSVQVLSHLEFLLADAQSYSNTILTHASQLVTMTENYRITWRPVKSFFISKILSEEKIFMLKKLLDTYSQNAGLVIEFADGSISNVPPSQTAFVHRDQYFLIRLTPLFSQGIQTNATLHSAMKTFFEKSKAIFNHSESYQNYLDLDLPDFLTRYYGKNLKKLIQVKKSVDPENIFHHPHSIPLDFE